MAKVAKESEVVTFEDQQKINKFARINAKLQDLKGDLEGKRKELENLEDAENEVLMISDEDPILYPLIIDLACVQIQKPCIWIQSLP
ncbi:hypothetical protein LSH36_1567g00018 [Paralvinella palmiformis]|uniref:Prefoldin subunit 4 n=1 Tax=Paralvinella palmiformis TaxID=53620 RepID=A0AAD9MNK5_9ANNE|nr:hypothetical protein LSH36_1567g00018 [Paralvinella palmiformis]